ncbi:hypothetical protein N7468_007515 [Penicillium chermesinum]|uniref:Uncharacterized protein n=1 Tax=Penicillium chermesinum TaxID=63820 RepID=A0A9W9NU97_9EURO|nr:uncharacterized protein N7468_007515 [Penicillium chermesinum]KAJ5226290.1 hypothetical protein N7468_007515 [Penicillium chermesinum]
MSEFEVRLQLEAWRTRSSSSDAGFVTGSGNLKFTPTSQLGPSRSGGSLAADHKRAGQLLGLKSSKEKARSMTPEISSSKFVKGKIAILVVSAYMALLQLRII